MGTLPPPPRLDPLGADDVDEGSVVSESTESLISVGDLVAVDPERKGEGWEWVAAKQRSIRNGWFLTLIGLQLALVLILSIFVASYLFALRDIDPFAWFLSFAIGFGVLLVITTGFRVAQIFGWGPFRQSGTTPALRESPAESTISTYVYVSWTFYLFAVIWSSWWFQQYGETTDDAPVPPGVPSAGDGDQAFIDYQRLMTFMLVSIPVWAAFAALSWYYIYSASAIDDRFEDAEIDVIEKLAITYSPSSTVRGFFAFGGITTFIVCALYGVMWLYYIISVTSALNLNEYGIWFIVGAVLWVSTIIFNVVLYYDSRAAVMDSDKYSADPTSDVETKNVMITVREGQEALPTGRVARVVASVYGYHYRVLWIFHLIGILWIAYNTTLYAIMLENSVIKGGKDLGYKEAPAALAPPEGQANEYYVAQVAGLFNAAMIPVFVYMAATVAGSWSLFNASNIVVLPSEKTASGAFRFFSRDSWTWDKSWIAALWVFETTINFLVFAELLGWFYLNKHFFDWWVSIAAIEWFFVLIMAYFTITWFGENWSDDERRYQMSPTIKLARVRTLLTFITIAAIKTTIYWVFWADFVKPGDDNRIPKDEVRGNPAVFGEAANVRANVWTLHFLLYIITVVVIYDYANNLSNNEVTSHIFTTTTKADVLTAPTSDQPQTIQARNVRTNNLGVAAELRFRTSQFNDPRHSASTITPASAAAAKPAVNNFHF